MSRHPSDAEIEAAAAELLCFGQPANVDHKRAWAMLLEEFKPRYRAMARAALEAAAAAHIGAGRT